MSEAPDDDDERIQEQLARDGGPGGWDTVALAAAFKSSLVESFEIAIVVIGLGTASGNWFEATGGALVATVVLTCSALWLRASLEKVPVKPAKFLAATLLMGFGTYWVGEGIGFGWPGGIISLIWLPPSGDFLWSGEPYSCVLGATNPRRR